MNDAPLGTARGYADLQPILRARADALGLSRETIDRIAGVPSGYASKVLAEIPMRKLGPETLGPMLGALGVMLVAMPDPEAVARYAAKGEQRVEKYALNAAMHTEAVHIRFSRRKLRKNGRKGGANSRKFVGKRMARKLARKAANMRWHKPKIIEVKGSDAATLRALAIRAADTSPGAAPRAAGPAVPPRRIAGTGEP